MAAAAGCSDRPAPVFPPPDGGVAPTIQGPFLATGARHTCAIFSAGAVRCWGENSSGQLGRPGGPGAGGEGDPLASYSVDLGADRRAAAVFAGLDHTCVILEEGTVKCWGLNSFGQLGLEDDTNRGDGLGPMGDALPRVDLGPGRRAVSLALGGSATCALLDDGLVKCWGDAYQGALGYGDIDTRGATAGTMGDHLPVVDLGSRGGVPFKAKQLAAVDYHSFCAILTDGRDGSGASDESGDSGLKCWGSNDYCELAIGTREGGRGGEPGMMGNNLHFIDLGITAMGAKRKAAGIAAGFQFVCALGDDGAVKCWGDNQGGQLGIGTTGSPRSCAPDELGNAGLVPLSAPAVAISARGLSDGAGAHVCARLVSGEVTCWGENGFGQLGTGDTASLTLPSAPLAFGDGFAPEGLVLGNQHSCAVSAHQRVKCWGSNANGQLGAEAPDIVRAPGVETRLRGHAVLAVGAGHDHTCAVLSNPAASGGSAGGVLKCWGRNADGQLGLGDRVNRGDRAGQMGDALPTVDVGGAGVMAVAAGAAHTCVVLDTGALECWGAGGAGQLGPEGTSGSLTPSSAIQLAGPAVAVAAGADFTCALLGSGQVSCFGDNGRGQLGVDGPPGNVGPTAPLVLGAKALALAAGDHHACALLEDFRVACWGANDSGQLGLGDTLDRARPTPLTFGATGAASVSARTSSTCVLLRDKQVTCWGDNARGQLGLGDANNRLAPPAAAIDLGRGRVASALSLGGAFACALLDTRQARCWGDNQLEQLGSRLAGPASGDQPGETGDSLAAAFQGGGRSVRALASGRGHTCAILDTNDVRCWGDNVYGQLGAGDLADHSLSFNPTAVVDLGREL